MEVHGREIRFRRTVLGNCEIADLCPKGDINRFGEVLQKGTYSQQQMLGAKFMVALSKGYEMTRKYAEPDYTPNPLTAEEALLLDDQTFNDLFMEAMNAFIDDGKTTVETAPPKKAEEASE